MNTARRHGKRLQSTGHIGCLALALSWAATYANAQTQDSPDTVPLPDTLALPQIAEDTLRVDVLEDTFALPDALPDTLARPTPLDEAPDLPPPPPGTLDDGQTNTEDAEADAAADDPTTSTRRERNDNEDDRIHLLHADILYKSDRVRNLRGAEVLIGNVKLSHQGAILDCDSALYYRQENSFDAFDNVVMTQGDTLKLVCDSLYYDGYELRAEARGEVTLYHNDTRLETEHLDYDRLYGVGMYYEGGTLFDADNVLDSFWGQYTPATHEAFFTENVQLTNPKFRLLSDTLFYYTDTEVARIVSPTNITSNDGTFVYGLRGIYDTRTGQTSLMDRSYIIKDMRTIVADSLYSDSEAGYDEAFGNAVLTDDENLCALTGDYCIYYEQTGNAMATDRAVALEFSSPDTLYIHGDTLRMYTYNLNTDSVHRNLLAYYHVRMFRNDVQGVCDSMISIQRDSCTYMYGQPILWNEVQQVFGEEIDVYNNDSTIDWIHVINQAMTVQQLDSVSYNQVASREMFCYFRDGEVVRNEAKGNVLVVYYIEEDDGNRIGVNYTETSELKMYLQDKRIHKIWMPAATATMYPEIKLPKERQYLPAFAWFDYIRPQGKDDLFDWRSKDAANMLTKTEPKVVPLQKLDMLEFD